MINTIDITPDPAVLFPPSGDDFRWVTTGTGKAECMTPLEWELRLLARLPDRGDDPPWPLDASQYPDDDDEAWPLGAHVYYDFEDED